MVKLDYSLPTLSLLYFCIAPWHRVPTTNLASRKLHDPHVLVRMMRGNATHWSLLKNDCILRGVFKMIWCYSLTESNGHFAKNRCQLLRKPFGFLWDQLQLQWNVWKRGEMDVNSCHNSNAFKHCAHAIVHMLPIQSHTFVHALSTWYDFYAN